MYHDAGIRLHVNCVSHGYGRNAEALVLVVDLGEKIRSILTFHQDVGTLHIAGLLLCNATRPLLCSQHSYSGLLLEISQPGQKTVQNRAEFVSCSRRYGRRIEFLCF